MTLSQFRTIKKVFKAKPTLEGAGVKLNRIFGFYEVTDLDPFLLLDHFQSDNPEDYLAGFPWHPHRGIETITYMHDGIVNHEDSMGNKGTIRAGEVQWMTAGSGIIHQEMPKPENGKMGGFQLWVNLPKSHKMMHPRYREINRNQIPELIVSEKVKIKIISGKINGIKGPIKDIITDPEYYDITIEPKGEFIHHFKKEHTVIAYIYAGSGTFDEKEQLIEKGKAILFDDGEKIKIRASDEKLRALIISGKPIKEPIAWRGPIVMNTNQELHVAFEEVQRGTFIKYK